MKVRRIALLLPVLGAMWGCQMYGTMAAFVKGTGWTGGSAAGVSITQYTFNPGSVSFPSANAVMVTWTNNDGVTHNVTSDGSLPFTSSADLAPGMSYSLAFPAAGSYTYHCSIHTDMKGTITVTP